MQAMKTHQFFSQCNAINSISRNQDIITTAKIYLLSYFLFGNIILSLTQSVTSSPTVATVTTNNLIPYSYTIYQLIISEHEF